MPYTTAKLRPAHADVVVRDPVTMLPLADDGEAKPLDGYWARRLADGDVVEIAPPPTPKQAAAKARADAAEAASNAAQSPA